MNREEIIFKALALNLTSNSSMDLMDSYWKELTKSYKRIQFNSLWAPVDPGWWQPILEGLDKIDQVCLDEEAKLSNLQVKYNVLQIKEKFGDLRIYSRILGTNTLIDTIREIERNIVAKCAETCEVCGEPGESRYDLNWLKTLCATHYDKAMKKESSYDD